MDEPDLTRRALLALAASTGATALLFPTLSYSQSANIEAQAAAIWKGIGEELAAPLYRLGLLEFSNSFRYARIITKPLDYESEASPYGVGSNRVLEELYSIIPNFDPLKAPSPLQDERFIEQISAAYQKNLATQPTVFDKIRAFSQPLKNFTDDMIVRSQLEISLILRAANEKLSREASQLTFIYPFC